MFCCKKKCDLDITKFRKSNQDNDCFIHLLKNCLEHYNAMKEDYAAVKDRNVSLEKQNLKYKRKLKKRASDDSKSPIQEPKETSEAEFNQHLSMDELQISNNNSREDDMQVDEFDQNISERDVYSTYNIVKSSTPENVQSPIVIKEEPDTWKAKPASTFPKPKEQKTGRILKQKSLIQPTLDYFQKDFKSNSTNCSFDRTFCKELDVEMDKNVENREAAPVKKLIVSPNTKKILSLSRSKAIAQKDNVNIVESTDAVNVENISSNSKQHNDKPIKIKSEKKLSLKFGVARNVQTDVKSKIDTSVLFDTDGDVLSSSVIVLENESHKQPIIIDDTVLNNPESDLLQLNPNFVELQSENVEVKNAEDKRRTTSQEAVKAAGVYDCRECDAYYQYLLKNYGPEEMAKRIILCSKHNKPARPETPEGFWNVAFTPSP